MTESNIAGRTEEMDPFLLKALQEPRDRFLVLQLDKQLEKFMKSTQTQLQFPTMNGYQRMIVHKVAHYFGMMHTVDRDKKSVTVFKQKDSAIPMLRFSDLTEPQEDKLKKVVLLKRPQSQESSKEQREDLDEGIKEDEGVEDREEKLSNVVNDQITQSIQKMKISNSSNRVTNKLSGSTELRRSKKEVEPSSIAPPSPLVIKSKTHLTTVPTILTKAPPGNVQTEVSVLRKSNKTVSPTTSRKTMEEREEEYLKARARIFADSDKSDVLEWSPDMDNPIGNDSEEDKILFEQANDYLDSDHDYKRPLEPISYPSGKQMFSSLPNDIYDTSYENPWVPYENYRGNTIQLPTNNRGMIYGTKFGAINTSPYQTMISCPPNSSEYLSHTRNPTQMTHDAQPIHYTNHIMGMDNYRNPISNLNSRISDTNVWPYSIPNNSIHSQLSQIKNPQSEVLPCIPIVPNTFSSLSSNDPILSHPKANERLGASHIYQGRINPNQTNFGYYPNIGYPYIWKQENELEYDDMQKRDFIHGVFSNSDYIDPANSIYPTEDLNQRMSIPSYHGGYQHVSDTNFEERRTKNVNPNHPTLNPAPSMSLYGPPKQPKILEPFSQEQPNSYSPSLYIPGFFPNKLIVNPSNEMGWVPQNNLNNAMPSEDKSKLITMQISQKQQPKKQKPNKQKQKQKQKQKKVQEPSSNVSPTFLALDNLSPLNPYWEESYDILSELSGDKKLISTSPDDTQEQPQQPNHILEVISSPQSRNHIILQIKKHGGIIKDLKTTTIAIFKNKEVAKEVYLNLKGNDFYLKPFTLQMSNGYESFLSNKNPKVPSPIPQTEKEPVQPATPNPRPVQMPQQQPLVIQPKRTTMTTTITTTTTTTITTDFEVPQHSLPVNVKDTQPEDHVDKSVNNNLK